ncbi:MAG: VCBS repeat-containing protein, partial [Planctomycetes bacterium]|nr:VCBS repeat-containing protein [Planctomycetota bacterium]
MRERFSGPWVLCLLVACLAAFPSCAAAQTFTFAGYGTVQTGLVPEDIATGDLDSDGDLDIAAGNTNAGETGAPDTVSVLLNRGDGTFLPRSDHAAGDRPEGLTLGDLDGDGDLDIATADYNSSGVSVLLGDGAGSFSRGSTVAVSGRPRGIVAGDLDADGDLDIATANYDGNSVSVLRGAGDGSFALLATAAVGRRPEAIAKGRLNADGALDLATCDVNDDTVTPLLGNGDGTFARAAAAAVGDRPRHLRLADLDSDGLDDVLTADNGTSKVTVLRNAGGASFLSQGTLSIAGMAGDVYVASGDMNLDGWLDGLVSFASSDKVGVFPGAGGFLFGPGETVPAGDSPVGIAVADLDGDGRVDLAVANALDDNLHVYLGASSPGLVVLDNGQAGTSSVGTWSVSSSPNPYGASSLFAKGTQARYAWSVGLPWPGTYSAYSWWTQSSGRAKAVPYALTHATGTSTVTADQTRDGGRWNLLATRSFGAATVVEVRSTSTTLSTC